MGGVSLVIPARQCAATIGPCLDAVVPMQERGDLDEIIVVDDGSTDETPRLLKAYPVTVIRGTGQGPGAARNLGWRRATSLLVWFIDSDCVAEDDALTLLLPFLEEPKVAGVGGSYGNMHAGSLLACLIHEEIRERHRIMPERVNFLATFNVLYRRSVLEAIDGFDERFLKGQDAELAFRVIETGHELRFEKHSCVAHYHPTRWRRYLATQRSQGYWRVALYRRHRDRAGGDSYSSLLDHVQPPLAMLVLVSLPLAFVPGVRWAPLIPLGLLALAPWPMTWRLVRRMGEVKYVVYAFMSVVRAFWRGLGMTGGVLWGRSR